MQFLCISKINYTIGGPRESKEAILQLAIKVKTLEWCSIEVAGF